MPLKSEIIKQKIDKKKENIVRLKAEIKTLKDEIKSEKPVKFPKVLPA